VTILSSPHFTSIINELDNCCGCFINYHKLLASLATSALGTIEEMKRNEARTNQNSILIRRRKGIRPKDANFKRIVERGLRDRDGEGGGGGGSDAEGTVEGSGNRVPAVGSHHEMAVAADRLF
jgi:hypothetical protein